MPAQETYQINHTGTFAVSGTALALGTATTYVSDENFNYKGVMLFVNVTEISGTNPSLSLQIQNIDHYSSNGVTLLSTTAITGTGTAMYTVYPSATPTNGLVANFSINRYWRVKATPTVDTATCTCSIAYTLIP